VPKCAFAAGLLLVQVGCRYQDLYVRNKTDDPVQVTVPGQTVVTIPAQSYAVDRVRISPGSMEIIVERQKQKRTVACPCPPGSDVLDVRLERDGRVVCAGS
jgi:hypothetical protein